MSMQLEWGGLTEGILVACETCNKSAPAGAQGSAARVVMAQPRCFCLSVVRAIEIVYNPVVDGVNAWCEQLRARTLASPPGALARA